MTLMALAGSRSDGPDKNVDEPACLHSSVEARCLVARRREVYRDPNGRHAAAAIAHDGLTTGRHRARFS
jgi:hypothetical protein